MHLAAPTREEDAAAAPRHLLTVWKVGYRFER